MPYFLSHRWSWHQLLRLDCSCLIITVYQPDHNTLRLYPLTVELSLTDGWASSAGEIFHVRPTVCRVLHLTGYPLPTWLHDVAPPGRRKHALPFLSLGHHVWGRHTRIGREGRVSLHRRLECAGVFLGVNVVHVYCLDGCCCLLGWWGLMIRVRDLVRKNPSGQSW
jgi:hypothetical protein